MRSTCDAAMFPRLLQPMQLVLHGLTISVCSFIAIFCPTQIMSISLNIPMRPTAEEMLGKVLFSRGLLCITILSLG